MGLTLYYDWKTKIDPPRARRAIAKYRALALKLPFDKVSEIYEQDPPDGKARYRLYDAPIGEENLHKSHLSQNELLDQIAASGVKVGIRDDSKYAKHRDVNRLLRSLREWDAIVANIAGGLTDALQSSGGKIAAPIKDRPDF